MITVGPFPLLIIAIGTRVTPQASSCGECGIITNPTCLPGLSKSTVVKAELRVFIGPSISRSPQVVNGGISGCWKSGSFLTHSMHVTGHASKVVSRYHKKG